MPLATRSQFTKEWPTEIGAEGNILSAKMPDLSILTDKFVAQ